MDSQGSLVDTNIRIYPSKNLLEYINTLTINDDVPLNIARLVKGKTYEPKHKAHRDDNETVPVHLNSKDIENLNKIKAIVKVEDNEVEEETPSATENETIETIEDIVEENDTNSNDSEKDDRNDKSIDKINLNKDSEKEGELHLTTSDIDWLYLYLQKQKNKGIKEVPYLHVLLEGAAIETPGNKRIKRNPVLEARCVKLRAQQEAREYRKMTKSVDNVRIRYPEDSISYQMKQLNRQLIAIGQFIISIFAGFLFGFRGVEWMVGNLDFGFRLLLGVMCALVIALAEIYFLAKKLNEELNIPETIQLGGPPKFADQHHNYNDYTPKVANKAIDKEHQD